MGCNMKIALASDLHLERGDITLPNTEMADVLILSGDICVSKYCKPTFGLFPEYQSERIHDFFTRTAVEFNHIIYVVGNHEHYNSDFSHTIPNLKNQLCYIPNVHILDNEVKIIDNISFIGGTLWTDMNGNDPETKRWLARSMNDFRVIQHNGTVFTPDDAIIEHNSMLQLISDTIDATPDATYVMVGHHSPSFNSVAPEFQDDQLMNGGYHSNLARFILDRPQIKLWTHGHTHSNHDYTIGNTRIVCNPRGYINYEKIANNFKLTYYTVE